ncbi:MAG TPA: ABC transporter permease [Ruminococcaceae bacterium]|jgi:ribose transport system permease protein|nr:ABC transporter permease [Oscillospiraceae bacterium]HBQ46173.1 ABC transporter permease [Oscillospiraceae bacterium]HBT91050.1 ABC transporter permease [Oscillospiraceae bacterium]
MGNDKKAQKRKSSLTRTFGTQEVIVVGVIVILFLFFSLASQSFRRYTTVVTLCNYMYYILLMAIGVTFPLITAGVDLSIGTGIICYSIVGSYVISQMHMPVGVGMVVTMALALLFGFLNGIIIAKLDLPPFIVTLCTMMIVRGLGSILAGGLSGVWPMAGSPGSWCRSIFKINAGGKIIPIGMIWMILLIVIMSFVLRKTRTGRYIIAIGSNKEALRLSGVNVVKWQVAAYLISGFFAGLAAIAYACTFSNITPGTGAGLELDAIGGAIIGGTSMTGGSGSIFGTFLGVLVISLLKTGLPYVGLQANWQQIITGLVLIGAVTMDMTKRHKAAG